VNCSGTRFLNADHQGSIVAQADCGGNPIAINAYDEYGIPSATNLGRFQYTGQAWLPELGMYHYKARIYSPTLGRFLQTDPSAMRTKSTSTPMWGVIPLTGEIRAVRR
jgi:RHS repeat-associated protein